jgi:outer membrane protein TolC
MAELTLARAEERLDDVRAERAGAVAALNQLLDLPADDDLGRVRELPEVLPPPSPWEGPALENSADVAARLLAVTAAEARLAEKKLELWPEFMAGAGYGYRESLDPVVTLRLGVQVPLWAGQNLQPEIRASEHELEMARAELREAEAMVRAEATRLQAEWTRAQAQVRRYEEEIIPRSQAALDAAQVSYANGRGPLSTVIADLRMWLEARSELARRMGDRFSVWAAVEALTAPPYEPPVPPQVKEDEP